MALLMLKSWKYNLDNENCVDGELFRKADGQNGLEAWSELCLQGQDMVRDSQRRPSNKLDSDECMMLLEDLEVRYFWRIFLNMVVFIVSIRSNLPSCNRLGVIVSVYNSRPRVL